MPRVVLLRMLLNVAIDLAIGLVPFFGDIADIFWKSNTRNMALLEAHVVRPAVTGTARGGTGRHWLFVGPWRSLGRASASALRRVDTAGAERTLRDVVS